MKRKESSGGGRPGPPGQERTFEQALERLEQIVEQLEGGEEPLEQSLRLYEEAVGLWRFCEEQMRSAQERVEKLMGAAAPPSEEESDDLEK